MLGVVAGNHLRKRQIEPGRRADAGDWRLRRRGVAARDRLAHEGVKSLLDPTAEYSVRFAPGGLKLHDVHVLAEPFAKELDWVRRRPIGVRRVDPDDAGDAIDMPQRHLPYNKTAPVMTDEDRLVDLEIIKQPDEIAGEVFHIVGFDRLWAVGRAVTALIRRNHPNAGSRQRLDLVAPGKCDFRPAVAEND